MRFDVAAALRTIRYLAGKVGPREASSASYRRAAGWVRRQFESTGYRVHLQPVRVPAGNSWGVDVPGGTTWNVLATPPGFERNRPHLVIGAHLDTVPQAPGAEDDASGIGVVLELARMAARGGTRLPVEFVAFGGEEPRGSGDRLHHFGSTAMIERMPTKEHANVVAMVALDRVGVGKSVPVCTGGLNPPILRAALLRLAAGNGVAAQSCLNTGSDHWSFEKAGVPAARVGGTSYPAYHSAADVPSVVNPHQLTRVAHLLWTWISA